MSEITITRDNFNHEVLDSEIPVLVDFWADWCGPCKMLSPHISEIAQEYAGRVKVCKVNVDNEPYLAAQFKITSIPTLILFRDGQVVNTALGYRPKAEIEAFIQPNF